MASNTGNKRVATKHIRDGIKSKYPKKDYCEITGETENLEFHHYHTLSILLKNYSRKNRIPISTDEEVIAMRDKFYETYWFETVEDGVTLTSEMHSKLHRVYGREPSLASADKQRKWVQRIKDKLMGTDSTYETSGFSKHITNNDISFSKHII